MWMPEGAAPCLSQGRVIRRSAATERTAPASAGVTTMIWILSIPAAGILAMCLWLLCWWDTAEPTIHAYIKRRAAPRDRPPLTDAGYCVIFLITILVPIAIFRLFH
jgi:hypothetical protein